MGGMWLKPIVGAFRLPSVETDGNIFFEVWLKPRVVRFLLLSDKSDGNIFALAKANLVRFVVG